MNKIAAILFVIGSSIIAATKMQYLSVHDNYTVVITGIMLVLFSIIIVLGNFVRWSEEEMQKEYKQKCGDFYDKHLCPECSSFMKRNELVIKNRKN